MNNLLKDKYIVITGASGDIGLSCCETFYNQGANLILLYNKNRRKILNFQKNKKNIYSYSCDFINEKEVSKISKKLTKKFNEINSLINCCGIMESQNFFLDEKALNLKKHMQINTINTIFFTKMISRSMIRSKDASIVNISSIVADCGAPSLSNYATSKGSIKSFTIAAARELGPLGVRVNSLSPGIINTKLHKGDINKFKKKISLGRLGKVNEVSNVALFLISDLSSYINGQDIKVDGQIKLF